MAYDVVVIGYDGSDNAEFALDAAADAVAPEGTVHVVTAFHPESNAQLTRHLQSLPDEFKYVYDPAANESERQDVALARLRDMGVNSRGHVVPDDPASAIIDVAQREGADLVVVGSRGLGGITRFLRGSVSARVATHAPSSVLIVHHTDDDE